MPVTVHEVTMATPNIVCVEYRDEFKTPTEVYLHGQVETGAYDEWHTRTHPTRGSVQVQVTGKNKEYWMIGDIKPTDFLDRVEVDDVGNWGSIGGLAITQVCRRSTAYSEGVGNAPADFFSSFRHCVYLVLSGNLAEGSHTIVHPAGLGLSNTPFTFNDKVTRCCAIRVNQVGYRPNDVQKKAVLGQWIPFYGTEGVVEYAATYSINEFSIIDQNGDVVFGPHPITLRLGPTDPETIQGPFWNTFGDDASDNDQTLKYYISLTQSTIQVQNISAAVDALVTAEGHGLSNGARISIRDIDITQTGTRGMQSLLSGFDLFAKIYAVTTDTFKMARMSTVWGAGACTISNASPAVVTKTGHGWANDTAVMFTTTGTLPTGLLPYTNYFIVNRADDTFQVSATSGGAAINTSSAGSGVHTVYQSVNTADQVAIQGGDDNGAKIMMLHKANRAGTYTYDLDFTSWNPEVSGTYRIWIEGLGTSDSFLIHNFAWHNVGKMLWKGIYNQRNGMALSYDVGGYERPRCHRHGMDGVSIRATSLPSFFSSESGFTQNPVSTELGMFSEWITATEVDWWGAHQDAGDWDSLAAGHFNGYWVFCDLVERITAARQTVYGTPKSSAVIGATYDGTDSLPDLVHEAIWGLDTFRRNQHEDGWVYGGLQFGSLAEVPGVGGGGANLFYTSWSWRFDHQVMAADHVNTYLYAGAAGKLSKVLRQFGFTALADTWLASAEAAFDWAEELHTNQVARETYYDYVKDIAGYSDPEWEAKINGTAALSMYYWAKQFRWFASASLMGATTGNAVKVAKYKAAFEDDTPVGSEPLGVVGSGFFEYVTHPDADPTLVDSITDLILHSENYWITWHESPSAYEWTNRSGPSFHAEENIFYSIYQAYLLSDDDDFKASLVKACHAQMGHFLGCNAMGRSFVTGLGARQVTTQLHADGELAGWQLTNNEYPRPPGTPCYVYTFQGGGGVSAFNLNLAHPQFPAPSDLSRVQKSDHPVDRHAVPLFEAMVESPWQIWANEYTIGGSTMPWLVAATFLHSYDGNSVLARRMNWS